MNREEFWTKIAESWVMPQALEEKKAINAKMDIIAEKIMKKSNNGVRSLIDELLDDDEDDDYDYQCNL